MLLPWSWSLVGSPVGSHGADRFVLAEESSARSAAREDAVSSSQLDSCARWGFERPNPHTERLVGSLVGPPHLRRVARGGRFVRPVLRPRGWHPRGRRYFSPASPPLGPAGSQSGTPRFPGGTSFFVLRRRGRRIRWHEPSPSSPGRSFGHCHGSGWGDHHWYRPIVEREALRYRCCGGRPEAR